MRLSSLMTTTALAALLALPAIAQETDSGTLTTEEAVQDTMTDEATDNAEMADEETMTMDGEATPSDVQMDEPQTIAEMTVDEFIGLPVRSGDGEDVGEIDYVIGTPGTEAQAVIGIGGFLGMGEYTVALPVSDFEFNAEERELRVGLTEEELRNTPEFDESGANSVDGELMMAEFMGSGDMSSDTDDANMEEGSSSDMSDTEASDDGDAAMDDGTSTESDAEAEAEAESDSMTDGETETETEN